MHRAGNLTTFMYRYSTNSGASISWNPKGLSRPVAGKLYLYLPLFNYIVITVNDPFRRNTPQLSTEAVTEVSAYFNLSQTMLIHPSIHLHLIRVWQWPQLKQLKSSRAGLQKSRGPLNFVTLAASRILRWLLNFWTRDQPVAVTSN